MKGSEDRITWFLDGMNKRFAIPVYQRKYDWKYENCRQLYDDLVKIAKNDRQSHFLLVEKLYIMLLMDSKD